MNHAVLFQQIIIEFVPRYMRRAVACFIVDFYGDFSDAFFYQKIRVSVVIVNIVKMILTVEKPRLFRAEGIGEKLDDILLPAPLRFQEKSFL